MIDTSNAEESSYDLEKTKVFNLPSMSQLVLGARSGDDDDDEASLNFTNLIGMEPPEGADFHASYAQVPKAKVKLTKKLKVTKTLSDSCPSFGSSEKPDAMDNKSKRTKLRGKINQRAQSATAERNSPSRSVSFTSTPPQHFGIEIPKPISPRRTKSMQNSFPISGSFQENLRKTSQLVFSSDGAFKPLHTSSARFSAERIGASTGASSPKVYSPTHRSFTIMPSESGDFLASPLQRGNKPLRKVKRKSQHATEQQEGAMVSPRSPPHRKSLDVVQVAGSYFSTNHGSDSNRGNIDNVTDEFDDDPSIPRRSPPPRSKSLDELAMALFKSPVKYDVSKRAPQRRKPTSVTAPTPETTRRKKIVPARQIPCSPRRSTKRSSFLVRSKSAKLVKSSGSVMAMESDASVSIASASILTPVPPRRAKSLYSAHRKRSPSAEKPRLRLNLPGPGPGSRVVLDDNVSVSASEAVPIAVFASSKSSATNQQNKSQLKKAFKETLHLVGKWKRKSKQEDRHTLRPLRTVDLEVLDTKDENPPTPQTSATTTSEDRSCEKDEQRKSSRGNNKQRDVDGDVANDCTPKELQARIEEETRRINRRRNKTKPLIEDVAKDSLADALEAKEARLINYLTKTPQTEKKKVDRYWIEAFKRNYARRNDVVTDSLARSKPN